MPVGGKVLTLEEKKMFSEKNVNKLRHGGRLVNHVISCCEERKSGKWVKENFKNKISPSF